MKHKRIFTRLAAALLVAAFLPTAALADNWYLEDGDITVSATESGQTVSQGNVTKEDSAPVIGNRDAEASTDNTVTIVADKNATANVTLKDANIDVSAEKEAAVKTDGEGDVTLTIEGENTVKSGEYHAGVEKKNDGNLTITTDGSSQGSLSAEGGFVGSGIGGAWSSVSNITIEGDVQLKATGGDNAAGIGSAASSCSNITIRGNAKVEATGGHDAAGIGSGSGAKNASDIIIEGNAEVIASGQGSGAGIGTGTTGDATNITIRGNAKVEASATDMGAGIGGGRYDGKNITIEGNAKVSAKGHLWAAGIGGGANGVGENIKIRGNAQVSAIGGRSSNSFGAGIGALKMVSAAKISRLPKMQSSGCKAVRMDRASASAVPTPRKSSLIQPVYATAGLLTISLMRIWMLMLPGKSSTGMSRGPLSPQPTIFASSPRQIRLVKPMATAVSPQMESPSPLYFQSLATSSKITPTTTTPLRHQTAPKPPIANAPAARQQTPGCAPARA